MTKREEDFGILNEHHREAAVVMAAMLDKNGGTILDIADLLVNRFKLGHKVLIFGNGGSYADALHFVGELEGAYRNRSRPPLSAIAPNPVSITAIGNDFGYDETFKKFVKAHAYAMDVVIGISTSGNSPNVLEALKFAHEEKIATVGITGETGGAIKPYCNYLLNVPSTDTPRIQEAYKFAIHEICDIVERDMFGSVSRK